MTEPAARQSSSASSSASSSPVQLRSRRVSRAALVVILVLLVMGVPMSLAGAREASMLVLGAACLLLASLPALAVITALVDRVHQRDWPFALAAAFVITLIVYGIVIRL
jgi:hypothetical protein